MTKAVPALKSRIPYSCSVRQSALQPFSVVRKRLGCESAERSDICLGLLESDAGLEATE